MMEEQGFSAPSALESKPRADAASNGEPSPRAPDVARLLQLSLGGAGLGLACGVIVLIRIFLLLDAAWRRSPPTPPNIPAAPLARPAPTVDPQPVPSIGDSSQLNHAASPPQDAPNALAPLQEQQRQMWPQSGAVKKN